MKKSPHQLRKKSDDKLRIDFHEPYMHVSIFDNLFICTYIFP